MGNRQPFPLSGTSWPARCRIQFSGGNWQTLISPRGAVSGLGLLERDVLWRAGKIYDQARFIDGFS
jgi:hypothetical protein